MKVMTLNLKGFFDWDDRREAIERYIKNHRPDVVLFQEVVYLPQVSSQTQVGLINQTLAYPYSNITVTRLQTSPLYKEYREGLALLSRLPIASSETLVLKQKEGDPLQRLVQFFDVFHDGVIWKFANVHFAQGMGYAYTHFRELMAIMEQRGEKRIIVGDFNFSDLERHDELWHDEYTISTQLASYLSFPEGDYTIDYFLVPKEYKMEHVHQSSDNLSDHRAITAEITPLPAAQSGRPFTYERRQLQVAERDRT